MTEVRRALVVIDVQLEYFGGVLPIGYPDRAESLVAIKRACATAERNDIPVVMVRHENPAGAGAFAADSPTVALHPDLAEEATRAALSVTKRFASAYDGTGLAEWLTEHGITTVTLVGYMTNNCVLATAAASAPRGITAEVLSDATGAIPIANDAGVASARQVHETLMTLLHSNFAAVATTDTWERAVAANEPLQRSNLVASARVTT